MKTFSQHLVYSIVVFFCAFSFVHWTADGISTGPAIAGAIITDEMAFPEERAAFDKGNPLVRKAMDTQRRYSRVLMEMPDVVGTATGLAEDNSPAVMVFTRKKLEAGAVPEYLEGTPVRVKVTGDIFALRAPVVSRASGTLRPTSKFPMPVPIGVSTGNEGQCSAGTIGARTKDNSGKVYALSNNHVYALENAAPLGSDVLQPGLYDTRCRLGKSNVIGTLYSFVPIYFDGRDNTVDAAIAISSTDQLGNATPSGGYGAPNSLIYTQATGNSPSIGQSVKKYGRTTGLTTGTISEINVTVKVCYDTSCNLIATFVDQIAIGSSRFSKAGDSGSLIVSNDSDAYPIGLLFAGGSGVTFANPIDAVLDSFNVSIDGK